MWMKIKIRHELNGRLVKNGEIYRVEYNPAEHIYFTKDLVYVNGGLYDEDGVYELSIDSIYIDDIKLVD